MTPQNNGSGFKHPLPFLLHPVKLNAGYRLSFPMYLLIDKA